MASAADVVVIGGGLAGAVAAARAAELGKRVTLVRAGGGASVHASGAFDVAASLERHPPRGAGAGAEPVREHVRRLLEDYPHHPYHLVGEGDAASVERALAGAADALFKRLDEEGLLYRGSLQRNLRLVTPGGRVKESAFAQDAIAASDLVALTGARVALVALGPGAEGVARQAIEEVRRRLDDRAMAGPREWLPCPLESVPVAAAGGSLLALARALDEEGACRTFARALARAVEERAPRATHLLLPAILGVQAPAVVAATLARETGRAIAETVALPPSAPGERLERALRRGLDRLGVSTIEGRAVLATALGGRVRSVQVEARGEAAPVSLEGKSFVLAAGRFLGGGLRTARRVDEPLFDLPVHARGRPVEDLSPERWFEARLASDHAAMAFGVRCGADLRPLGRAGGPAFENLFAAGAVLEGWSHPHDRTGLGVSLVTGHAAGERAAEAA